MDLNPILKFLHDNSALTIAGSLIVAVMWEADSVIRPDKIGPLGVRSESFWQLDTRLFEHFEKMFDYLYDTKANCRPSFLRYIFIGPPVVSVLFLLLFIDNREPFIESTRDGVYYFIEGTVVYVTVASVILDYISTWKTRLIIELMKKQPILIFPLGLVDIFTTLGFVLCAWLFSSAIYNAIYVGSLESVYANAANGIKIAPLIVGTTVYDYFGIKSKFIARDFGDIVFTFGPCSIAAIVPAVWTLLYASSILIGSVLKSIGAAISPIIGYLDFDSKPMRINGLISGILLILCGTAVNALSHLAW